MCFHSSSKPAVKTPAPAVSEPVSTNATGLDTQKNDRSVKAKGKRRLTIPVAGSSGGTGINV